MPLFDGESRVAIEARIQALRYRAIVRHAVRADHARKDNRAGNLGLSRVLRVRWLGPVENAWNRHVIADFVDSLAANRSESENGDREDRGGSREALVKRSIGSEAAGQNPRNAGSDVGLARHRATEGERTGRSAAHRQKRFGVIGAIESICNHRVIAGGFLLGAGA